MEKLYTIDEVAELLHISTESVRRYLREGEMGGVKLLKSWLVRESDLEKFLADHAQAPKPQKPKDGGDNGS